MRMHRLFSMAENAQRLMVFRPVIVLLSVYVMGVQVFLVGGVAQINPALSVFAPPTIFRSVARTGFSKADAVVVDWRRIVGMEWQSGNLILRISCKILTKQEVLINLVSGFIVQLFVHFI